MDILNLDNIVSNFIETLDNSFYTDEPVKTAMSYIPNYQGGATAPQPPTTITQNYVPVTTMSNQQQQQNVSLLKRKMTLDLSNAKRPRVFSINTPGVIDVLSSPDVLKLQIPTPELDKFIMNSTNPDVLQTPTSVFFPKMVTAEQELYAKGFEHALKQLHDQDSAQSSVVEESSNASSYRDGKTGFVDFSNVVVKEEPQTVPDSYSDDEDDDDDSSISDGSSIGNAMGGSILPVDMVSQEKIKLERKRQRNRLAASKCRKKKLERIAKLEDKVKQLKNENNELGNVLVKLRENVQVLKTQVYEHVQAGCPIVVAGSNNATGFS